MDKESQHKIHRKGYCHYQSREDLGLGNEGQMVLHYFREWNRKCGWHQSKLVLQRYRSDGWHHCRAIKQRIRLPTKRHSQPPFAFGSGGWRSLTFDKEKQTSWQYLIEYYFTLPHRPFYFFTIGTQSWDVFTILPTKDRTL